MTDASVGKLPKILRPGISYSARVGGRGVVVGPAARTAHGPAVGVALSQCPKFAHGPGAGGLNHHDPMGLAAAVLHFEGLGWLAHAPV